MLDEQPKCIKFTYGYGFRPAAGVGATTWRNGKGNNKWNKRVEMA